LPSPSPPPGGNATWKLSPFFFFFPDRRNGKAFFDNYDSNDGGAIEVEAAADGSQVVAIVELLKIGRCGSVVLYANSTQQTNYTNTSNPFCYADTGKSCTRVRPQRFHTHTAVRLISTTSMRQTGTSAAKRPDRCLAR
jgi:hypothetical protein